jgi:hypothetical protein
MRASNMWDYALPTPPFRAFFEDVSFKGHKTCLPPENSKMQYGMN